MKHAFLIAVCVATLYPVLWVVKMALTPEQGFDASPNPFPTDPSLENFRALFSEMPFARWLLNSAVVSIATHLLNEGTK